MYAYLTTIHFDTATTTTSTIYLLRRMNGRELVVKRAKNYTNLNRRVEETGKNARKLYSLFDAVRFEVEVGKRMWWTRTFTLFTANYYGDIPITPSFLPCRHPKF